MKWLSKELDTLIKQMSSILSQIEGEASKVDELHDSLKRVKAMLAIEESAKLEGCANVDLLIEAISDSIIFDDFNISTDFTEIAKEEVRKAKVDSDTCILFHPKKSTTSFSAPKSKNPFSKKHFNLTEQARLIKANPELAARLKAEAEEEM